MRKNEKYQSRADLVAFVIGFLLILALLLVYLM